MVLGKMYECLMQSKMLIFIFLCFLTKHKNEQRYYFSKFAHTMFQVVLGHRQGSFKTTLNRLSKKESVIHECYIVYFAKKLVCLKHFDGAMFFLSCHVNINRNYFISHCLHCRILFNSLGIL